MKNQQIIPFYGGKHPELFAIERKAMDRMGKVFSFLNEHLPNGRVLDIGAGDGFLAEKLTTPQRILVPMEPDSNMIDTAKNLTWVKGTAQDLPFHNNSFDAVYATWAFFFPTFNEQATEEGLAEVYRVLKPDGRIFITDNAGDDEFCALFNRNIVNNIDWWTKRGFEAKTLDSVFSFDTLEEAKQLLTFWGVKETQIKEKTYSYKIVVFCK